MYRPIFSEDGELTPSRYKGIIRTPLFVYVNEDGNAQEYQRQKEKDKPVNEIAPDKSFISPIQNGTSDQNDSESKRFEFVPNSESIKSKVDNIDNSNLPNSKQDNSEFVPSSEPKSLDSVPKSDISKISSVSNADFSIEELRSLRLKKLEGVPHTSDLVPKTNSSLIDFVPKSEILKDNENISTQQNIESDIPILSKQDASTTNSLYSEIFISEVGTNRNDSEFEKFDFVPKSESGVAQNDNLLESDKNEEKSIKTVNPNFVNKSIYDLLTSSEWNESKESDENSNMKNVSLNKEELLILEPPSVELKEEISCMEDDKMQICRINNSDFGTKSNLLDSESFRVEFVPKSDSSLPKVLNSDSSKSDFETKSNLLDSEVLKLDKSSSDTDLKERIISKYAPIELDDTPYFSNELYQTETSISLIKYDFKENSGKFQLVVELAGLIQQPRIQVFPNLPLRGIIEKSILKFLIECAKSQNDHLDWVDKYKKTCRVDISVISDLPENMTGSGLTDLLMADEDNINLCELFEHCKHISTISGLMKFILSDSELVTNSEEDEYSLVIDFESQNFTQIELPAIFYLDLQLN